jgi:hypothetical protein
MNLLLKFALSAVLLGPGDPPEGPAMDPADALALLQSEHHFSIPILLLEDPATPTR